MKTRNSIVLKYNDLRDIHKRLAQVMVDEHTTSSIEAMKRVGAQLEILEWVIND